MLAENRAEVTAKTTSTTNNNKQQQEVAYWLSKQMDENVEEIKAKVLYYMEKLLYIDDKFGIEIVLSNFLKWCFLCSFKIFTNVLANKLITLFMRENVLL